MSNTSQNIAILASGSGSNAEKIANYFSGHKQIQVKLIISNKKEAGVFTRFKFYTNIKALHISKELINDSNYIIPLLRDHKIDFIILAGYLLKIPAFLVEAYPDRILNIHPALLPKFGGKGMYGHHVHKAVLEAREKESGISIHKVNAAYDEGDIIFQAKCQVNSEMTADQLASKVQQLEHQHYPKIIESYISKFFRS